MGEGLQADYEGIGEKQQRLESIRAAKESPQLVKSEVQKYRATYMNEVNAQKNMLKGYHSTTISSKAKHYLPKAMGKLSRWVSNVAYEGAKLQKQAIEKKKEKGEPLTKEDLNFTSLSDDIAELKSEMSKEKEEVAAFKQVEPYKRIFVEAKKANEALNGNSTSLAGLSSVVSKKGQQKIALERHLKTLEGFKIPENLWAKSFHKWAIDKFQETTAKLKKEIDGGNKVLTARSELQKEQQELAKLQGSIPKGPKKRFNQEEYANFLAELKQRNDAIIPQRASMDTFLAGEDCPLYLFPLKTPFYLESYQPAVVKLQELHLAAKEKKPFESGQEKPPDEEMEACLKVAYIRKQFGDKNKYLFDMLHDMQEITKVDKIYYDRDLFNQSHAKIKVQPNEVKELFDNSELKELMEHENENVKTLAQEVHTVYYKRTLDMAEKLIAADKEREKEIDAFEKKVINEEYKEILDKLHNIWFSDIVPQGEQVFLPPPDKNKNPEEYKQFLANESALYKSLVEGQSQVDLLLRKEGEMLTPINEVNCNWFKNHIVSYQNKIIANRAFRKAQIAREKEESQEYHTRELKGYRVERRASGDTIVGKPVMIDVEVPNYEEINKTYSFSECVEFLNPNNPDYVNINEGKGWRFIIGNLPQEIKDKFSVQAARIMTETMEAARKESMKEKRSIITKNKLFDKTREELGEQAKDYFEATELLIQTDYTGAKAAFQRYLEKTKDFSQEDLEKHKGTIEHARNELEALEKCSTYYEAIAMIGSKEPGNLDAGMQKLKDFLGSLSEADKSQYAEQVSMAKEQIKTFNLGKLKLLEEIKQDVYYLTAIKYARESGPSRSDSHDPFNYRELKGYRRQLMLPYMPRSVLTEDDKKLIDRGDVGLQSVAGTETGLINDAISRLRTRIENGEPVDFEKEVKKIEEQLKEYVDPKHSPGTPTFTDPDTGEEKVDKSASSRLFVLFSMVNSTDKATREKGCVRIAERFKEEEIGMAYTQKWLGRGLEQDYKAFKNTDRGEEIEKGIIKKLKADKVLAANIEKGAMEQWRHYVRHANQNLKPGEPNISVDPPDPSTIQAFKTMIFKETVKVRYEREIRQKLTEEGKENESPALKMYNWSLPYNQTEKTWSTMFKPWTWSNLNEDNWNKVEDELIEFAVETVVTLPIGMGAGAIGKVVGKVALKSLSRMGFGAKAFSLIEKGGLRALMNNRTVWRAVSPALRRRIIGQQVKYLGSRGLAGAASVGTEGAAMLIMNEAWESRHAKNPDQPPGFFDYLDEGEWSSASLKVLESTVKAGMFRGIGAGQHRVIKALAGKNAGVVKKLLAIGAGETLSGFGGTGVEALHLIAQGMGDQVTMEMWTRALIQNSLQSFGTHVGSGQVKMPKLRVLDSGQRKRTQEAIDAVNKVRLKEIGVKSADDITSARLLSSGRLEINGFEIPAGKLPMNELPPSIREKIKARNVEAVKADFTAKLAEAGITDPAQLTKLRKGRLITAGGHEIVISDPSLLPEGLQVQYERLRREEIHVRAKELGETSGLLAQLDLAMGLGNLTAQSEAMGKVRAKAEEMGMTVDQLRQEVKVVSQLDSLYANEHHLYHETKVIKKPILDTDGSHKIGPDGQPMYERVNLFENYETKASAYSQDLLKSLTHEELSKQGGTKIIKIGGDELVVYHAGPDGKVQKLFIDISNMGPTNSTATDIGGSRINLVDIYLHKISERIAAQSKESQGKPLDPAIFNQNINDVAGGLFALDVGPDGRPIPETEARAKFEKLKNEWGLEGKFEDYMADVQSMRALAEYRADTRFLDASFKGQKGKTFTEHIAEQLLSMTGITERTRLTPGGAPDMPAQLQMLKDLVASNPDTFRQLFADRLAKSQKLNAPTPDTIFAEIARLDPKTSKPEDMMMLYSMMARIDLKSLNANVHLKPIAESLKQNRKEMVGDPPHPRVETARIMDAKVVSIDIPPELAKALSAMAETNPVQAQAILTAARKFAEIPLDNLKYQGPGKFARFNIMDHVQIVNGKVRVKPGSKEFNKAVRENVGDKKVQSIVDMEKGLAKAREKLEALHRQLQEGTISQDVFTKEMRAAKAEMAKIEDRLSRDPDTGAYSQSYLDLRPSKMYSFGETSVPKQHQVWDSVVTELGHAGVINSKYGYLGMDQIMAGYHKLLQQKIASELPPNLQHFKIIRAGGGAFEVVFLDARAVDHLAKNQKTPASLIADIATGEGQQMVDRTLQRDPAALAKAQTDGAVRNSQFKYGKGTDQVSVGQLLVTSETNIGPKALGEVHKKHPNASAREMIGRALTQEPDSKRPIRAKKGEEGRPATVEPALPPSDAPAAPEKIPGTRIARELFESGFSNKPPKELKPDSPAWIDEDGRISYNIDHLNPKVGEDGTVAPSPFLAEGYEMFHDANGQPRIALMTELRAEGYNLVRNKDGTIALQQPRGKTLDPTRILSVRGYHRKMKGTPHEGVLFAEMRRLKNHEQVHRVATFVPDVTSIFAKRDEAGNLPEGKIELTDAAGKPVEITRDNAEEFIANIGDGSVKDTSAIVNAKTGQTRLERHFGEQLGINGFRFSDSSKVDTKLLATNPREAFRRARAAAKGGVIAEIRSATKFNEALRAENMEGSNYPQAHQVLLNMMWAIRSGDPTQISLCIDRESLHVDRKVLERIQKEIPAAKKSLEKLLLSEANAAKLEAKIEAGEMSPVTVEVYRQMQRERKLIQERLSDSVDGKPKTEAQKHADLADLRDLIGQRSIDLNDVNLRAISQNPEGLRILAERPDAIALVLDKFPDTPVESLITEVIKAKPLEYSRLSQDYAKARSKGKEALDEYTKQLSPEKRKVIFAIEAEARQTRQLLSDTLPDGTPKSAEQISKDSRTVRMRLLDGERGIGRAHLEALSESHSGRYIIESLATGRSKIAGKLDKAAREMYKNRIIALHVDKISPDQQMKLMKNEYSLSQMSLLARDTEKRLSPSQINKVLDSKTSLSRIKTLEANIDHPELTPALIEKVLTAKPIITKINGKPTKVYDAEYIGEGAQGRVFKAAIVQPNGRFELVGCKVNKDGTPQPFETQTAALMARLIKDQGLDTTHLMKYESVSDDGKYVFLRLYDYTDPSGRRYRQDVDQLLSMQDEVPNEQWKKPDPEVVLRAILGGGEGLVALEKAGVINPDSNLSQYVPATDANGSPTGVHIDLGNVMPRAKFGQAPVGEPQYSGENYKGRPPEGIGVTGGYYNQLVYEMIQSGKLPAEKHHNYTFGVALYAATMGVIPMMRPIQEGRTIPPFFQQQYSHLPIYSGYEMAPTQSNRSIGMDYPQAKTQKLIDLATKLTDPNSGITMAKAVAEMKKIIEEPNQTP